jgi:hypothetical protein
MLKLLNPWLISDHLVAQEGKTYSIRFPLNPDEVMAYEMEITDRNQKEEVVVDSLSVGDSVEIEVAVSDSISPDTIAVSVDTTANDSVN